jgi:hypothetical protein
MAKAISAAPTTIRAMRSTRPMFAVITSPFQVCSKTIVLSAGAASRSLCLAARAKKGRRLSLRTRTFHASRLPIIDLGQAGVLDGRP